MKIFDFKKASGLAHLAAIFFLIGFLLQFFNVFSLLISSSVGSLIFVFLIYLIGAVIAIISLLKSRNAIDDEKLKLHGYIENGLAILPVVLAILYGIFAFISLNNIG